MTDLTEQWKKGKLPEGYYYVKDGESMIAEYLDGYFYNNGEPMTSFSGGVDEILAEVPDYVEWRNMVNCACEEHEANKRLIEENAQLKERLSKLENKNKIFTYMGKPVDALTYIEKKIEYERKELEEIKKLLTEQLKGNIK